MLGEKNIDTSVFFMQKDEFREFRAQETQLVMGLKFHFSKTLSKAPLHVVLNAMAKTWESCQEDVDDDKTLVCSREILNREIKR